MTRMVAVGGAMPALATTTSSPPKASTVSCDRRLDGLAIGDVGADAEHAAVAGDPLGGCLRRVLVEVHQGDRRAS